MGLLLFGLLSEFSLYAYDVEIDGFYYNILSPTTLEVTSGDNKYEGKLTIPEKVTYNNKTYDVVLIGASAFKGCDKLISITMGKNITKIGARAFYGCSSLEHYSFYTSDIGSYAFAYCTSIKSAKLNMSFIPDGMFCGCSSLSSFSITATSIGSLAFAECTALTGDLKLGCSVGYGSFSGCTGITSVTFNASSSIHIGVHAFANCTSIKSVKLVSKSDYGFIYGIGKGFGLCPNLEDINVDDYRFGLLKDGAFYTVYISSAYASPSDPKQCLEFVIPQKSSVFVVPSEVKYISAFAFSTAGSLRRIVLGSEDIKITRGAFVNCPDLKEIYCYSKTPFNIELCTPPEKLNCEWFHEKLYGKLKVYVPTGCKSYYDNKGWSNRFIIEEFDVANFDPYSEISGIAPISSENAENLRYSVDGRKLNEPTKGINIIRMKDGTTKKVLMR